MAKYTTQLRTLIESDYPLFEFSYPIFDEAYRGVLEQKIIDHFYFREIGFETAAMFKHFLKEKLNRIMPYYNQLYGSEHLITSEDYMINHNSVETHTKTSTQDTTGKVDSTTNNTVTNSDKSIFSDTPQGKLNGLDYATNLTEGDGTTTEDGETGVTSTGKVTTVEEYEIKLTGGGGLRYNADILMEWRKSFLNIDEQIVNEMNDLFMNIY